MDIRQISIRYRQDHDRILVDINTGAGSEVQVWLTRRMSLRLWPLLNRVVIDHFAIPQDAKTDGFVDLADFNTPYHTGATQHPLGRNPLVVTEVSLTPYGHRQLQLSFREVLEEPASNRGFQIDLSTELVFALIKLMGHALEQSQWEVGQLSAEPLAALDGAADEIDLSPDATRPTYLN